MRGQTGTIQCNPLSQPDLTRKVKPILLIEDIRTEGSHSWLSLRWPGSLVIGESPEDVASNYGTDTGSLVDHRRVRERAHTCAYNHRNNDCVCGPWSRGQYFAHWVVKMFEPKPCMVPLFSSVLQDAEGEEGVEQPHSSSQTLGHMLAMECLDNPEAWSGQVWSLKNRPNKSDKYKSRSQPLVAYLDYGSWDRGRVAVT